jgi:hypothetical protein
MDKLKTQAMGCCAARKLYEHATYCGSMWLIGLGGILQTHVQYSRNKEIFKIGFEFL